MTTVLKKVDRVKSVQEAIELQDLGIDFIGISLSNDSWFTDNRCVEKDIVIEIRKALFKSKLIGEVIVEDDFYKTLSLIDGMDLDYIQIIGKHFPSPEFMKELKNRNIGLIYGGIDASYEDDPSWILSDYMNASELNPAFFQLDLLGDIENSWKHLTEDAREFASELQIEDIEEIGRKSPIIITLDYTVHNVLEIMCRMPTIRGICMTISEGSSRNDIHFFSYSSVIEIAKQIHLGFH
jgi:hypothetical protein